jgi:hypothetical protein
MGVSFRVPLCEEKCCKKLARRLRPDGGASAMEFMLTSALNPTLPTSGGRPCFVGDPSSPLLIPDMLE